MKFVDAPIGARFKFSDSEKIFVKLNSYPNQNGLICSWNGNVKGYQSFYCFVDEENGINYETDVILV